MRLARPTLERLGYAAALVAGALVLAATFAAYQTPVMALMLNGYNWLCG